MSEDPIIPNIAGPFHPLESYPGGLAKAELYLKSNGYHYWFVDKEGKRYTCPYWLEVMMNKLYVSGEEIALERVRNVIGVKQRKKDDHEFG